ncbi:WD repeat-containing protein 7, partial [Plakobranchus ocellatus]
KPLDCSPALTYVHRPAAGSGGGPPLMLRGDSDGRVTVWALPQVSEKQMTLVRQESFDRLPALSPKSSTTLQNAWSVMSAPPTGILDGLCNDSKEEGEVTITATIYIPSQGKLVCGRKNGTIVIVPAIECIKRQLLILNQPNTVNTKILCGHHGRVTCLLYPFNESTRYEPNHLLSGGTDFSVILWDVNAGLKIHTFTVHGGPLSQMTVPPANCNPRILTCVCSVAGDHSVALLSLKERKCLLLASRHLYPVKMIKWRPLDDFMLVQTKDGVVTVWQMETGHLDRVIDGKTAEDVLANCDENATPVEALTNPSITLAQALKRRNLATFRNLAQQKLHSQAQPNPSPGHKSELIKPTGFPLLIQGVKTNIRDADAHVLFFDTEALIVHLLTEEYSMLSPAELEARGMAFGQGDKTPPLQTDMNDAQQKIADSESDEAWDFLDETDLSVSPTGVLTERGFRQQDDEEVDVDAACYSFGLLASNKGVTNPPASPYGGGADAPSLQPIRAEKASAQIARSISVPSHRPSLHSLTRKKHARTPLKNLTRGLSAPAGDPSTQMVKLQDNTGNAVAELVDSEVDALHNFRDLAGGGSQHLRQQFKSHVLARKPKSKQSKMNLQSGKEKSNTNNYQFFFTLVPGLLAKAKEKAETVGHKIQSKVDALNNPNLVQTSGSGGPSGQTGLQTQLSVTGTPKRKPDSIPVHESLSMAIGELFMSCLHAWNLDPSLDELCVNKLGLHKPRCPVSFGLLSHGGHMSLMLPGWHRHHQTGTAPALPSSPSLVKEPSVSQSSPSSSPARSGSLMERKGSTGMEDSSVIVKRSPTPPKRPPPPRRPSSGAVSLQQAYDFSTKLRWQISCAVTTQHLLSVISVANTLMGMTRAVFLQHSVEQESSKEDLLSDTLSGEWQAPQSVVRSSPESKSSGSSSEEQAMAQAQVKQGWSLLAALHCVLLPELIGPSHYQHPQLEMLARRWQDRCLEIREAAQALLLAELRRINPEGRKRLLDQWAPFLPSYVDPELSLLSNTGGGGGGGHGGGGEEGDDEEDEEAILAGDIPAHKLSVSFESRRKQATAIVMLGVIGAEFGHEMEPSRAKTEEGKRSAKGGKGTVEGFSLTNYSLSRHTSKALTFLLLQPPSPRLPLHTPIRRAAIDLIGRGFTVWEPYLDVSSVLLGLLELSIDAHKLIPSTTYGLPLSPAADACRSARHALSLIATARPPAFVITMAKEVARYNALAQTAQHQHAHLHGTVLARASAEILHVIELLVEKIPNDVADLIVEAMDVTMFCLDLATLKAKGLPELFPAICRFSMVAYCHQTKRVWVGARNGMLALYELKQHSRCQMVPAHNGPITAVAVNQDGKYVATFSHIDNKLKFWQTASTSLFGIGSQGTKLVRSYSTPAIAVNPVTNILKLVRLVWVDKNVVVLLTVDGKELKFTI